MATDTINPPKPETRQPADLDQPGNPLIPAVLLALLLAGLGWGVWQLVNFLGGIESTETVETKFVFRRLTETVTLFEPIELGRLKVPGRLFWLAVLFTPPLLNAGWVGWRYLRGQAPTLARLIVGAVLFLPALVFSLLALRQPTRGQYLEVDPYLFWIPTLVVTLLLGLVYVVWMYVRDSQSVGWLWATFLGVTRFVVYLILAGVFLLPALQTWEKSEAHSRLLLLLDVSQSMHQPDEVPEEGKPLPPTRLDQVLAFLNQDQRAFLKRLLEKNPVFVYNFGGKLDEEFKEMTKDGQPWTDADWRAWVRLDLKQWFVDDLSNDGKQKVRNSDGFEADKPGTPAWAEQWARNTTVAERLTPEDREKFEAKKQKLDKRLLLYRDVLSGTNYGDSVLTALTRESTNMLAGIIVIGDGQSNQGSPSTYEELRRRASAMKVPIFTIGVGEVREQIAIRITDLQAPEQAPPDDKFMVRVEVDGEGLADRDFLVLLDIYRPDEPKTPAMTLKKDGKFKAAGGVPHGTVEFMIDPAAEEFQGLRNPMQAGKPELLEGEWKFVARIARAKGEAFQGKEHVSDPALVQVVKKPLRVLLFAGGPTREYQFARRLFVNEVDKKRAELSVYLQVSDPKGARVQDVPNERLLKAFPNFLRVDEDPTEKPEDKYYNLAQYDLIIAFDPDWLQVSRDNLDLLQKWVDLHAGGLIVVGGPIHTFQLAREKTTEKLKPLIDLFPVRVEDSRLAGLGVERQTNRPWRLRFPGASAETDYLKIDETQKEKDGLPPGWSDFFGAGDPPVRGIYSYYPVKSVKPTATVVGTFTDPQARLLKEDNTTEEQPFLVTMPFGKGKTVWIGSGELWRLRLFKEEYHERFWTKLGRYAASGTQTRQTRRGAINVALKYTVGQYVRLNAPLYGPDLNYLPPTAEVQVKITPPAGAAVTPNPLKLSPRKEGDWSGQFEGRFLVNAPGEYQLELAVPGSSEIIRRKITVTEANPEMDNLRPNFGLLRGQLAGTVADLRVGEAAKNDLKQKLRTSFSPLSASERGRGEGTTARDDGKDEPPLYFDLRSASLIPDYLTGERKVQRSRGPIQDLWPAGPEMSLFGVRGPVGLAMLLVVGLLSLEWLTRKLLKLA